MTNLAQMYQTESDADAGSVYQRDNGTGSACSASRLREVPGVMVQKTGHGQGSPFERYDSPARTQRVQRLT